MKYHRVGWIVILFAVPFVGILPQDQKSTRGGATVPAPSPLVKLELDATPSPRAAFQHKLYPSAGDQTSANAAVLWLRAGANVRQGPAIDQATAKWLSPDPAERTPLKGLPRDDMRVFLERVGHGLEIADRAALCDRSDWELQSRLRDMHSHSGAPLDEIQNFRELANRFIVRARFALAEGRHADALASLRTGYVLGKHVGEGPSLIHTLVGVAISAQMSVNVEEFVATPGAPNLYWALARLPKPFIDLRRPVEGEMALLTRSFPFLSELDPAGLTEADAQRVVEGLIHLVAAMGGEEKPPMAAAQARPLVMSTHAEAKRVLVAQGRKAEEIEKMPAVQVVGIYVLEQFRQARDNTFKWSYLPYWQAGPAIRRSRDVLAERLTQPKTVLDVHQAQLMPAMAKVSYAHACGERRIAILTCIEGIRAHAATHQGQFPARLADILDTPVPRDPMTGRDFEYSVKDGKATLRAPPPTPGEAESIVNTMIYELTIRR